MPAPRAGFPKQANSVADPLPLFHRRLFAEDDRVTCILHYGLITYRCVIYPSALRVGLKMAVEIYIMQLGYGVQSTACRACYIMCLSDGSIRQACIYIVV